METTGDKSNKQDQPVVTPLLLNGKAVAAALSIGLSLLYQMDRSGQLGPMGLRLGRRRLWRLEELRAWVQAGCPRRELWVKMAQEQGFGHQLGQRF
jgi:hypothetical protein